MARSGGCAAAGAVGRLASQFQGRGGQRAFQRAPTPSMGEVSSENRKYLPVMHNDIAPRPQLTSHPLLLYARDGGGTMFAITLTGHRDMVRVTRVNCTDYLAHRQAEHTVSDPTIERDMKQVKAIYAYAERRNWLEAASPWRQVGLVVTYYMNGDDARDAASALGSPPLRRSFRASAGFGLGVAGQREFRENACNSPPPRCA
jgi:hypothetical protein